MKRLAIILAIISLLFLAQIGYAADLKAGWYANIYSVNLYTYNYLGLPQLTSGGYFYNTPPGEYGPFHVSAGNPRYDGRRYVTVSSDVYDVGSNQSLLMPVALSLVQGTKIAYLSFSWQTNYDADQMYLELWSNKFNGTNELVWSQRKSGLQFATTDLLYDTDVDGTYTLKINVVPEPSCMLTLLLGIAGIAISVKRGSK